MSQTERNDMNRFKRLKFIIYSFQKMQHTHRHRKYTIIQKMMPQ